MNKEQYNLIKNCKTAIFTPKNQRKTKLHYTNKNNQNPKQINKIPRTREPKDTKISKINLIT